MKYFPPLVLLTMYMPVLVCGSKIKDVTKLRMPNELIQDVPSYFRRLYEEWSVNSKCNDQVVRSSQAEVRRRSPSRFAIKARIPKHDDTKLIKSEIRIEFHNVPQPRRMANRNYTAEIIPMDSTISREFQQMQDIAVDTSFIDMSFNVTAILLKSLTLGKKNVNVRLNIQRKLKLAKELHGSTFKAFLIVHVADDTCRSNTINVTKKFVKTLEFPSFANKLSPRRLTKSGGKQSTAEDRCRLQKWQVFTEDTDFFDVIVYPTVLNANSCHGECQFPLHGVNTTDHAFLRAYMYFSMRGSKTVQPCCVPQSLGPAPMIIYDRMENSYLITDKPNLVAKSCACL